MMTENLQTAIDKLRISDVYLKGSISQCVDGFEPKYDSDIDKLEVQTKHLIKQAQVVKLDETQFLMRVFLELGARWIDNSIADEENSIRAFIEAEFIAEYRMDEELEQACVDEYALKNASFHVWPYWRELLMNQCNRMYLPRYVLPTVQFAQNRHQVDEKAIED
jgi:hypothetical protein